MSVHFMTNAEVEANLDRFSKISPAVLKAIEDNRDAFMALMSKIFAETNGELIRVHTITPEEAAKLSQLNEDGIETRDTPADPALIEKVKGLLIAVYLTSFFVQDVPFLEDTIAMAHSNGVEDGYAYIHVKRMQRN